MHIFNILVAVMGMLLMVNAFPVEEKVAVQDDFPTPADDEIVEQDDLQEPENHKLNVLGCPSGWKFCGKCNGTSCKVAGLNFKCKEGTACDKGHGGGDGKLCGSRSFFSKFECPGAA